MTRGAERLPVRPTPEELQVAAVRCDVVDDGCRSTAHDTDGMRCQEGGAFLLPLPVIAALTGRRPALVVAGLAFTVGALPALAPDAGGNHFATSADAGRKGRHGAFLELRSDRVA